MSALKSADPGLADEFDAAMQGHIVETTAKSYDSVTRKYVEFCDLRGFEPWPARGVVVAAWILRLMISVKPSSVDMYLAGVRNSQISLGFKWDLTGDQHIYRVRRYVKRLFPCREKGLKVPITLQMLSRMLPRLCGWPDLSALSRDDLLFACASVIAVVGFLRGGEFTFRQGQARPILMAANVYLDSFKGSQAVVVGVPQAKTTFWLSEVNVPCFAISGQWCDFCPVRLWKAYTEASPLMARFRRERPHLPAFHFADGTPISRSWMVDRSIRLIKEAGVELVDGRGRSTSVFSSSWRSGGVQSAQRAGLSEALIMELGRWKSNAWMNYLLFNSADLSSAMSQMWDAADTSVKAPRVQCIGEGCSLSLGPKSSAEECASVAQAQAVALDVSSRGRVRKCRLIQDPPEAFSRYKSV